MLDQIDYHPEMAPNPEELRSWLVDFDEICDEDFVLLPTYHIDVRGNPITVSIVYNPNDSRYFFLAQNASDDLVGYSYLSVQMREGGEPISAGEGHIQTFLRGKGYNIPMELVRFHFLQLIADSNEKDVEWGIFNDNGRRLKMLERAYDERGCFAGVPVTSAHVEAAKQEQIVWQAIYGNRGKLGFVMDADDKFGAKMIRPGSTMNATIHEIDKIYLERASDGNYVIPRVSRVTKSEDLPEMRARKLTTLRSIIAQYS